MKTMNDYQVLQRVQRISVRRELTNALEKLEGIYKLAQYNGTPAKTVNEFVASVGASMAVSLVATLVNVRWHDGRISPRVREWARQQESAWDYESAIHMGIYSDNIHAAHLNQIAQAMMKV